VTGSLLRAAESAPVTDWGPRIGLTLAVVGLIVLGVWGMRRGWRARATRQADVPAPPPVPDSARSASPAAVVPGTYVATTTRGDLLDRIVVHGLGVRGRAQCRVLPTGVLLDRTGEPAIWIPRESLLEVRLGSGQAQKAYESGGVILIAWQLGGRSVETGFRADDPEQHLAAARAVSDLVPVPGGNR
jgi:hypothetical protein